jgi:hypothetical protein
MVLCKDEKHENEGSKDAQCLLEKVMPAVAGARVWLPSSGGMCFFKPCFLIVGGILVVCPAHARICESV